MQKSKYINRNTVSERVWKSAVWHLQVSSRFRCLPFWFLARKVSRRTGYLFACCYLLLLLLVNFLHCLSALIFAEWADKGKDKHTQWRIIQAFGFPLGIFLEDFGLCSISVVLSEVYAALPICHRETNLRVDFTPVLII